MTFKRYIRPIKSTIKTKTELILLEISAAVICAIFAFLGYHTNLALLFYPTATVTIICTILMLHHIYDFILDKYRN